MLTWRQSGENGDADGMRLAGGTGATSGGQVRQPAASSIQKDAAGDACVSHRKLIKNQERFDDDVIILCGVVGWLYGV